MGSDENDERPRSISPYDYSDKSIRHAWIAVLAYAGLRAFGALIGSLREPAMAVWFGIDFAVVAVLLGGLALGIHKESRVAVVSAIVVVIGMQILAWVTSGWFSGTIVSVIVTGFLLRGAKRIFEHHAEGREARDTAA
jgi:hypothetical protein